MKHIYLSTLLDNNEQCSAFALITLYALALPFPKKSSGL